MILRSLLIVATPYEWGSLIQVRQKHSSVCSVVHSFKCARNTRVFPWLIVHKFDKNVQVCAVWCSHLRVLETHVTHCNTLHHAATHCNTLQHTATHCNTLHHAVLETQFPYLIAHNLFKCAVTQSCVCYECAFSSRRILPCGTCFIHVWHDSFNCAMSHDKMRLLQNLHS